MKEKAILLVDDDKFVLASLARELAGDGRRVTEAASGELAIDTINHRRFDLVITDLAMPGPDGFEVLKASKRRDPRTMVMIMTGNADLATAVEALRLGADDFLEKPCDTDELLRRVATCLANQELAEKASSQRSTLMMCCYCRKIRDAHHQGPGKGRWYGTEEYFNVVQGLKVSHGCCPECLPEQIRKVRPWIGEAGDAGDQG